MWLWGDGIERAACEVRPGIGKTGIEKSKTGFFALGFLTIFSKLMFREYPRGMLYTVFQSYFYTELIEITHVSHLGNTACIVELTISVGNVEVGWVE